MSKPDTERKKRFKAKLHKRKDFLNVHLSKALKEKLKTKKRALLVRKGDKVKVMRGTHKGKEGKVTNVDYIKVKVHVEGILRRTARGREVPIALEPSKILLIDIIERTKKKQTKSDIKQEKKQEIIKEIKEQKEDVKEVKEGPKINEEPKQEDKPEKQGTINQ